MQSKKIIVSEKPEKSKTTLEIVHSDMCVCVCVCVCVWEREREREREE